MWLIFSSLQRKIICLASIFICSTLPSLAAGNRVGNGGDAVVCRGSDKKIEKIELLDFYEEKNTVPPAQKGVTGKNGKPEGTLTKSMSLLEERLNILKKVHPRLAIQFQKRLTGMPAEISFREEVRLTDVPDSLHAQLPLDENCKLEQLAIRQQDPSKKVDFLISSVLWSALHPRSQAGLILHELIYEYFYKLGETDSRKARLFNSLIWSDDLAKMSAENYWIKVRQMKLAIYN